jgi:hypothetical protein
MHLPKLSRDLTTGIALVALLAVTRIGHFGGIATPPDASLAVFFLLGLWVASARWLLVALLAAGLTDALAVAQGIGSYCITPAYPFLIPTYGVLWGAGRATRVCAPGRHGWLRGLVLGVALLASTTLAFALSNASFYALSGYFAALPARDFVRDVSPYFRPYLAGAVAYVAVAIVCRRFLLGPERESAGLSSGKALTHRSGSAVG